MLCYNCQKDIFLIRGLCFECAPEIHNKHKELMELMDELTQEFRDLYGKEPLTAWDEFEQFYFAKIKEEANA